MNEISDRAARDAVPGSGSGEVWTQAEVDEICSHAREQATQYQQYCD